MIYFVLIFSLLYFILSWRRLDWAVMFLIVALPAYLIRFNIFGIPSTLLEAMILISFGVWFITNFNELKTNLANLFKRNNKKIKIDYPFRHEIVLMLIISFIAAGISGFSSEALGIWKAYFFEPVLLFIVIINVFGARKKSDFGYPKSDFNIEKILWPLVVSALAVSAAAIYQKITGNFIFNEFWAAEETRRATSFFGYPNAVGLYLGPVVLLLVGFLADRIYFLKNQKPGRDRKIFNPPATSWQGRAGFQILIIVLAIIFSVAAIYFAKSEGALIGIIVGLVGFRLLAGKKARWITMAIIILSVSGIMMFAPAKDYAKNKILLRDLSGQIRKAQWAETWEMLKGGRLFLGSGLSNYQNAIKPYHQEGIFVRDYNDPDWHRKTVFNAEYRKKVWQPLEIYLYPHNIILNFWSELGLAGMLLFIWIFIKFYYLGIKILFKNWKPCLPAGRLKIVNLEVLKGKYVVLGLMGAMAVIVVHGLVDVPYFKNDLAVMFWLMVAMIGIMKIQHDYNN
jgi:O-antigen ligase